jgi:hypothetical protein
MNILFAVRRGLEASVGLIFHHAKDCVAESSRNYGVVGRL